MSFGLKKFLVLTVFLWTSALAAQEAQSPLAGGKLRLASAGAVPDRYIVVLKEDRTDKRGRSLLTARSLAERERLITDLAVTHKAKVGRIWLRALPGFSARLTLDEARKLAADPRVLFVEQVAKAELSPAYTECTVSPHDAALGASVSGSNQLITCNDPTLSSCQDNWGLDRIDQANLGGGSPPALSGTYLLPSAGATVHAYLMDTGITLDHQEYLNASSQTRIGNGVNVAVDVLDPGTADLTDAVGNSHGTHTSAILGGVQYGVAKNVILHPVRITHGSTFDIDRIIDGIDWILENHPAGQPGVANLSANAASSNAFLNSTALALAARRLIQGGVTLVNSAGNHAEPVEEYAMLGGSFPSQVLVVGASTRLDKRWILPSGCTFNYCASNYGAGVDLFAPGERILSASNKPDDRACFLTGTSMAAPHATGTAAVLLAEFPNASPGTVEKALKRVAALNKLDASTLSGSPNRLLQILFPTSGQPVAGDLLFDTLVNTSLVLSTSELTGAGIDWGNGSLTFVSATQPAHGTVSVAGGTVTYAPTSAYTGADSFTYTVRTSGFVNDTGTIEIQVGGTALPPIAVSDGFAVKPGQAVTSTTSGLLTNDLNPSGGSLAFHRFLSLPAHGVLTEASGSWTYTPDTGFLGLDRFTYRVKNSSGLVDVGTVDVRVGDEFDDDLLRERFDDFNSVRDPGDPLNGVAVQAGSGTWSASSSAGFGTGILTNLQTVGFMGGLPFQPGSHTSSRSARLAAVIDSTATGWTGFGFSSSATGGYWSDGQVWIYLRPSGRLYVAANGTTHYLYDSVSAAPGFVSGWNYLELEYDWVDKTVRAWINGTALPIAVSDLDDLGFAPNIQYVGVHAHPGAGGYPSTQEVGIDDFHLTLFDLSTHLAQPENVNATYDTHNDKIRVTWDAVSGATLYKVYRLKPSSAAPKAGDADLLPQQVMGTTFDDHTVLPDTHYYYWVQAVNSAGQSPYSSATLGQRDTVTGQTSQTFTVNADATVKQDQPTTNFGSETSLGIRHTATGFGRFTFIRFDLSALGSSTRESATLEVRLVSPPDPGITIYKVSNMTWNESTVTWNNWGAGVTAVPLWKSWSLVNPTSGSGRLELDVTDAVDANGIVTIGIATDFDQAGIDLVSRENGAAAYHARLKVYYH